MRRRFQILLTLLFTTSLFFVNGQKVGNPDFITAADLSYEQIVGTQQYQVTLTVFTECGSTVALDQISNLTLNYRSDSLNIGVRDNDFRFFVVSKITNGEEVPIFCKKVITKCSAGLERGVKKYTYRGVLDLSTQPKAKDWKLFWRQDFRTRNIKNFISIFSEPYFVETNINNLQINQNSSPVFGSSPLFTSCVGSNNTYNLLARDADGDSLMYSLRTPLGNIGDKVNYAAGFDSTRPMNLVNRISITNKGVINLNPSTINDIGLTEVVVKEIRKGVVIGNTSRAFQINSFSCANKKPVISGIKGSTNNFKITACVGDFLDRVNFGITASDPDADQNVFLSAISISKSGWSFGTTGGGKTDEIWFFKTITLADTGITTFVVQATDDGCPTVETKQQTFTLEVVAPPVFNLGSDFRIPCDKDSEIKPSAIKGKRPFKYTWSGPNGFANITDTIVKTRAIGSYFLTIQDVNGCKSSSSVRLNSSLEAYFKDSTYCLGRDVVFKDSSISYIGSITSRTWEWGDGTPNLVTNDTVVKHIYNKPGLFSNSLTVTNEVGCTATVKSAIEICEKPQLKLSRLDSCQIIDGNHITDITDYKGLTCGAFLTTWSFDSIYNKTNLEKYKEQLFYPIIGFPFFGGNSLKLSSLDTGTYSIGYSIITLAGCLDSTTIKIKIYPNPKVEITNKELTPLSRFDLICNRPDTLLVTNILQNPNGGENYSWNTPLTVPITGSVKQITANKAGPYIVEFKDKYGCKHDSSITINFPVVASFQYDTVCKAGNAMKFFNTSTAGSFKQFEWDFGDGSPKLITTDKNPVSHLYAQPNNYIVSLKAIDNNDCDNTFTNVVYNTYIKDIFSLTPNVLTTSICATDVLSATSVESVPNTFNNVSGVRWFFGSPNVSVVKGDQNSSKEIDFIYTTNTTASISFEATYNRHTGMVINDNVCKYVTNNPITTDIKPEFKGDIFNSRYCVSDSLEFKFFKNANVGNSEVKLSSVIWTLAPRNSIGGTPKTPIFTTPVQTATGDTVRFKAIDLTAVSYDLHVIATDVNGCVYADIEVQDIANGNLKPKVEMNTVCQNEPVPFIIKPQDSFAKTWGISVGNNIIEESNYQSAGDAISRGIVVPFGGNVPIKVYTVNRDLDPIFNRFKECRAALDTILYSRPAPLVTINSDSVCANNKETSFTSSIKFIGSGILPEDTIITSLLWDFGDGTTSTEKNPKHLYKLGGKYKVSLTVNTPKCSFTDSDSVFSKQSPLANFQFDSLLAEQGVNVEFENLSGGIGSNNIKFDWNFGDGTKESYTTPINTLHTFAGVQRYPVTLVVTNDKGCVDSLTKIVDTDTRLDLPTAFSPNNDGKNDQLSLIYKLIPELETFKIFNRWGQLVFDGGNDVKATWDGKLNGVDQEIGVYVVHVKAKGKYNKQFNFKRNVTLIK